MNNCGNCDLGRKNGASIYCTHYGIPINPKHEGCKAHKPKIKEEKQEAYYGHE